MIPAIRKNVEENIARFGRGVIGVFPTEDTVDPVNEAFSYTVGNALKGLPELLVVGLYDRSGVAVLNHLSRLMIERGRAFDDGEMVSLGGEQPLCLIEVGALAKETFTVQATAFYDETGRGDYRLMQAVLCDKAGRFPWDAGCAAPYAAVTVWRERTQ